MSQTQQTPTQQSPPRYYQDEDKLTYDEAEILVERYFRQDKPREVTRAKHVLNEFDYSYSNHNQSRVIDVLRRRCEPHNRERSGPNRFKIPEEYR